MNEPYRDPVLAAYEDMIKAALGPKVKSYWQGDPMRIPRSATPAVILARTETRAGRFSNQEDEHDQAISVIVVGDIQTDIGNETNLVAGTAALYALLEGRNDDFTLQESSILYAIRHNLEVGGTDKLRTDLDTMTRIEYSVVVDKRAEESWSIEASLTFVAHFVQTR